MSLIIVGLGPGDPGDVTRKAWEIMSGAETVFLRTAVHPTVKFLPEGPDYIGFDDLYEAMVDFDAVYQAIVDQISIRLEAGAEVVYAVPGDPTIVESTVARLRTKCEEKKWPLLLVHGVSFIEPTLSAVQIDAGDGFQFIDALDIADSYHPPINPDLPALITQLYSQAVASNVKLTLMNQYPDEHPVRLIIAAGTSGQQVIDIPLHQLDHQLINHLASLVVPRLDPDQNVVSSFEGFQETIAKLRDPQDGCPWDLKQTHQSLRPHLIEETYEAIDAIDSDDPQRMEEEFGDLLLQIVLHSQIAVDEGEFRMSDVIQHIDAKMKRRHPHVWGDVDVSGDPDKVKTNWEQIKAQERSGNNAGDKSLLDGVPRSMPALAMAHAYDERARNVGFDWENVQGVVDKIREEIEEVITAATPSERFAEIGDVLLSIVGWARWLGVNPEDSLRAANQRFYTRFSTVERLARERQQALNEMSQEALLAIWEEAKLIAG